MADAWGDNHCREVGHGVVGSLASDRSVPYCGEVAGLGESHSPIHISKTVLSIVKIGPPDLIKSRTFTLRVRLAL